MKKKVSLIEIVSMKILLVVIVASYYWLWSAKLYFFVENE